MRKGASFFLASCRRVRKKAAGEGTANGRKGADSCIRALPSGAPFGRIAV